MEHTDIRKFRQNLPYLEPAKKKKNRKLYKQVNV